MIENDIELARRVREDKDNEALCQLIERHSGIYVEMVRRFGSTTLYEEQIQDVLKEKDIMIYQAAIKFDESKSQFQTYLGNLASYACLSLREKNKKNKKIQSIDDVGFSLESGEEDLRESIEKQEMLVRIREFTKNHQNKKVNKVFYERYEVGTNHKLTPWDKVGEKIGLTAQACINIHNKTIKEFRKKFKNEIG